MDSDDVVQPGDAALQSVLAAVADRTFDPEKRDRAIDLILTLPPLREWPTDWLVRMHGAIGFGLGDN